jgi:hypothetical protein
MYSKNEAIVAHVSDLQDGEMKQVKLLRSSFVVRTFMAVSASSHVKSIYHMTVPI